MTMKPGLRKFTLTAHVVCAVGWLGAIAPYLALAVTGLTSADIQTVRAAYLALPLIGWYVIVPFSLATLLTGLVQALGTEWGLFRHYWILAKFLLTAGAIIILLVHMPTVSHVAARMADTTTTETALRPQQIQLIVHAAGGIVTLLVAAMLSVFKPWGRTPYGRGQQQAQRASAASVAR